ncbi:MAG: type IV pilin protein [Pseudomonadota bacterium]
MPTGIRSAARRLAGYTLVELMVTVVVVFTLAAFAIPVYQDYLTTARKERIIETVRGFTLFQRNYHIEYRTYATGEYKAGGSVNTFPADMNFSMSNNQDQVSFVVEAGACGDIAECYRVIATDSDGGTQGTFEASTGTWTWGP